MLDTVITKFGKGHQNARQKLMDQITGDWGRFEMSRMFVAGDKPSVNYVFRNAEKVSLTMHEVKMPLVVSDMMKFIESNPRELDWQKTNIAAIGQRLVQENETKYLGKQVAEWDEAVKPRDNHWDARIAIEVPTSDAGTYLLKAKAGDGNTSWTLYADMDVGAGTNIRAYVADDEVATDTVFGAGFTHSLGGAVLAGGIVSNPSSAVEADLGVPFSF